MLRDRVTRREFFQWSVAFGIALSSLDRLAGLADAGAPARKLVGDIIDFSTRPRGWQGLFGFVTFRLHPVYFKGERAYHIRTDASEEAFAKREGLVFVPKLGKALEAGATADYYIFVNGVRGQLPVVSTVPSEPDFTPAFRLQRVRFKGTPRLLTSVQEIRDAESAGQVTIEPTRIVVNYPVVKWPGGELPVDTERKVYLGKGQLLSRADTARLRVTFKLHQCFPGEWYIVTDTSAVPMAPMMRVAPSPKTAALTAAGATAKILVFGNGIKGPGPMGFQPSIVDSLPGDAAWSPFWDHFTFTWVEGKIPKVIRSPAELLKEEAAGNLKRWPGTPDTKGELFVVNCPVPIAAPMTWKLG